MGGLDKLRTLAGAWDEWGLGGALAEIADQIERELREERDRWDSELCDAQMDKSRVTAVYLEMHKHCLGHEGMEDSPVARWARELRYALRSDASDGRDTQNPSWHDPADAAGVTSDDPKVTRDPAEDVSMSAYDLLPADEREAIAWVRDHGGLEFVKERLDWVVSHCSTKQQLDFDFWLSGHVMYELGFEEDIADRDEVERRLLDRLMPEGMEWLRYDTGEPVPIGGEVTVTVHDEDGDFDRTFAIRSIKYKESGVLLEGTKNEMVILSYGERVKRPAVLAADGEPLEVEQTVWDKDADADTLLTVVEVSSDIVRCEYTWKDGKTYRPCYPPDQLTHTKPEIDTWQRIEEDAGCTATKYNERRGTIFTTKQQVARDLGRRCKALAEKENRNE